ncbi:hypothetical protein D3C73_1444910 [compost metagenome]
MQIDVALGRLELHVRAVREQADAVLGSGGDVLPGAEVDVVRGNGAHAFATRGQAHRLRADHAYTCRGVQQQTRLLQAIEDLSKPLLAGGVAGSGFGRASRIGQRTRQ